jgi:hypothetical protein
MRVLGGERVNLGKASFGSPIVLSHCRVQIFLERTRTEEKRSVFDRLRDCLSNSRGKCLITTPSDLKNEKSTLRGRRNVHHTGWM